MFSEEGDTQQSKLVEFRGGELMEQPEHVPRDT